MSWLFLMKGLHHNGVQLQQLSFSCLTYPPPPISLIKTFPSPFTLKHCNRIFIGISTHNYNITIWGQQLFLTIESRMHSMLYNIWATTKTGGQMSPPVYYFTSAISKGTTEWYKQVSIIILLWVSETVVHKTVHKTVRKTHLAINCSQEGFGILSPCQLAMQFLCSAMAHLPCYPWMQF